MDTLGGLLFGIAFGLIFGITIGGSMVTEDMTKLKQEAIQHGYAHYIVVDSLGGKTEFQWK